MSDPSLWHRLQFAFTIIYHYLFPQLTMGLALLIVVLKAARPPHRRRALGRRRALLDPDLRHQLRRRRRHRHPDGVPVRHQLGGVLEVRRRRDRPDARDGRAVRVLPRVELPRPARLRRAAARPRAATSSPRWRSSPGSWLSGYFIICTNAFMQHPVGHAVGADGALCSSADFWAFLLNPWALAQYAHNMVAAVVTASFVMAAVGAYYALAGRASRIRPRRFLRVGVIAGLVVERAGRVPDRRPAGEAGRAAPAGGAGRDGGPLRERTDGRHRRHRPAERQRAAARQPDRRARASSASSPSARSTPTSPGSTEFPEDTWPDNIELLYYAFHVMAGLGTLFIVVMAIAALLAVARRAAHAAARMLWMLMLAFPFPYIANTAGWMTAELGRQPWLVYGLMRTSQGASPTVHSGTVLFTLIGFCRAVLRARRAVPVSGRPRDRARPGSARRAWAARSSGGAPWLSSGSPSPP